jgi:RNA polymerase sigma-70 factor, ECF subfamily
MADLEHVLDEEFLGRLRQFVRARTPSPQDAEDVVQDVLVKLLKKGGVVAPGSVRPWLFTVARHEIYDRWRSSRPRVGPLEDVAAPVAVGDNGAVAYLAQCMEPMLSSMTEVDRDLLRRVDVLEESQAVLAGQLGLSASGLKSRVQRARRRLRALLEGCCEVERDRRGTPVSYRLKPERPCPCSRPGDLENERAASGATGPCGA